MWESPTYVQVWHDSMTVQLKANMYWLLWWAYCRICSCLQIAGILLITTVWLMMIKAFTKYSKRAANSSRWIKINSLLHFQQATISGFLTKRCPTSYKATDRQCWGLVLWTPHKVYLWFCRVNLLFFFFKQKTAYEITRWLEFRRVLFRSVAAAAYRAVNPRGPWRDRGVCGL